MKKSSLLILLVMVLTVVSCSKEKDNDQTSDLAYAIVESDSDEFPILMNHEGGEHIVIQNVPGTDQVSGAVYISDEVEALVQLGPNNLPTRGYVMDHTLLFSNYEGSKVDLGIVNANGESQIFRGLELDGFDFDAMRRPGDLTIGLQAGGLGLSVMNCAIAAAIATGSGGLAIPLAVLGCSSALVTIIAALDTQSNNLDTNAAIFSTYANTIGCVAGSPAECIAYVIDIAGFLSQAADNHQNEHQGEIASTEGAMMHGYGDVQVTLTWNNTADLDLYVTDPFGETISYTNTTSASGGALDVDDTNGYGPENIFWQTGTAPMGQYVVNVDHYSGASPASFRVRVEVLGVVAVYNGSISDNENITVANFTVQEPEPRINAVMTFGEQLNNKPAKR